MELEGKLALVTGGGRGIGRAVALELAERGADVLVNYLRNGDAAEETAEAVRALGRKSETIRAHVGDPDKVERMFGEIAERWGYLDILVNNAASGVIRPLRELEPRHWDWTININARGAWLCAKAAVPLMDGRGGRIVGISSLGSGRVLPEYSAVGDLEGGARIADALPGGGAGAERHRRQRGLGRAGGDGRADPLPAPRADAGELAGADAGGRMVEPIDLARAVAFLCGPGGEMIRGQVIVVDGGFSLPI